MSEEKLYSQEELNSAVCKALCDMQKVLDRMKYELELAQTAFNLVCSETGEYKDYYLKFAKEMLEL